MKRTCYNTDISIKDEGREVTLIGWVSKKRNLGSLLFIDLRDKSGIIQIISDVNDNTLEIKNEYIISVTGIVCKKEVANKSLKTGDIEIKASSIEIINKAETTPLIIQDKTDALEDTRLKYRYLDLRRPKMQNYLITRAKICKIARDYFDANNFLEIETPMLNLSTPEGARDYLVPSRINNGSFYALPQSPQIFKQLLMIAGFERYYQIARCFRDEDLRQDRQPEFTQIDIETSFLDQEEILTLLEGFLYKLFKETLNLDIKLPLRRLDYKDAIETYGSDKPDTRFGMHLIDLKELLKHTEYIAFKEADAIKAIVVKGVSKDTSRKTIDGLNLEAKKFGLNGISVLKLDEGNLSGSILKFLNDDVKSSLIKHSELENGDIIIIAAGKYDRATSLLGSLRNNYAKSLNLITPNTYDLLWVVNWPLFSEGDDGSYSSTHHPFTRPTPETSKYLNSDPLKVMSAAYDIVINGYEAGGGSLRIYDNEMQNKVFSLLGLSEEEVKTKFGFFVDAFKYGTPPHAGIAFGLERLTMIIAGTENIRDVIAFPKNLKAACPMSNAPQHVDEKQLDELGIKIIK